MLVSCFLYKGALSWYGKLTWESAHAWNLIILCLLIVWGMTFIYSTKKVKEISENHGLKEHQKKQLLNFHLFV